MEIPLWVLRNVAKSSGARLPKLKEWKEPECCTKCGDEALLYRIMIPGTGILCRACHIRHMQMTSQRSLPRVPQYQRNYPWKDREEIAGKVKLGNLGDAEYRFWIGSELSIGTAGICRACGFLAVCKQEREEHKLKHEPACTVQLVGAYKRLLTKGKCLFCNTVTIKQRWGVPLCGMGCIQGFMFNRYRNYTELDLELMKVRNSGG